MAYAYAAYLSAWLKTQQPLQFFCRLLNAGGGYYPLPDYIAEAKKWGLAVLAPDVNRSGLGFTGERGAIRCGLMTVKGIGEKLAARIVENRGQRLRQPGGSPAAGRAWASAIFRRCWRFRPCIAWAATASARRRSRRTGRSISAFSPANSTNYVMRE